MSTQLQTTTSTENGTTRSTPRAAPEVLLNLAHNLPCALQRVFLPTSLALLACPPSSEKGLAGENPRSPTSLRRQASSVPARPKPKRTNQ